jgi:hypothetical protein
MHTNHMYSFLFLYFQFNVEQKNGKLIPNLKFHKPLFHVYESNFKYGHSG